MNKENFNIDNILKDKLMSFEGDIPLSDWNNIEKKLNRRKKIIFLLWSFISSLILVGGLISYNILSNKTLDNSNANKISISKQKSNILIEKPKSEVIIISENNKKISKHYILNITKTHIKSVSDNNINQEIENSDILSLNYIEIISKRISEIYIFNLPIAEKTKDLNLEKITYKNLKPKTKITFEAGINISPALGMEAIKENKKMSHFLNHSFFNSIAGSSAFGNGMNNGLNIQMNYGKKWFLRSGVNLNQYNVSHSYNYTISEFPTVDPKYGILTYLNTLPENVKYDGKSVLRFVNMPLIVGNRFYITSSLGFESKIGFNMSYFYSSNGKSVNPTYLNLEDLNNGYIKKWSKGYTISSGLFYKSKRNFIFTIEPNYSSIIGSAYNNQYPVKNRLYNYGLNFNINYILK